MNDSSYLINGFRIKMGRKRTRITAYENMVLYENPTKKKKKKEKKENALPEASAYAAVNYYNRLKKRGAVIREICHDNFGVTNAIMLTLTYDDKKDLARNHTNLDNCHYDFKKFIQRVNTKYENFKYVATFSRQNNGNWHYHVMCNFPNNISNNTIEKIWNLGITYVTRLKSADDFNGVIDYLVNNMHESKDELKGKRGYLCSKNCERDIIIDSWHEEQIEEFDEAFGRIKDNKNKILYETKNHLGIKGTNVNEDTGERSEVYLFDKELNPLLESAGYESLDSIYTYLSSSEIFDDKFQPLVTATKKQKKKKKRNNRKKPSESD